VYQAIAKYVYHVNSC